MVEAATEFRKNGFNDSDAATLAKTATMFQNVSDEAISAGDSASFIISQMIAFGIEAENAQSIIDKVNETANKFSVSSGDLSKALGIVASTSSAMGNSIDQTLGVVTAITEQTRNASKSARAANTIFSRLAQVVDENSDTGAKLTEIYNNLGIALYDSSGQMRSTYDILADLASKWDSLDKNTQQYIAITSAGTNQLNNFLALMNNFDHAAEATATSINSAGSAMRENEAYQESLEYQTNNLKATFQDLANNVIDKELISSVLKLSNAFLELANTGLGQFITKTTLLGGTAWGLSSLVKVTKIIPVITSQFKNVAEMISLAAGGAGTLGEAFVAVGGFAGTALPILLAVSAALVGIFELADYIENKDVRKLEDLSSALQDTNDKIAEMSGAGSEYDTLINNADKLTEKEQDRLGVLQAQLDTLKEQAAEQEAAYLKEWQSQQTEQKTETTHKLVTGSADEVPEGAQKLYGQYWDVVTTTEYTESQRAAENLRTAINNLNSEKRLGVTVGSEYISKLQGIIDEYQETYDTTIKVRDAGYELDDSQEYLVKVMEHQKEVISGLGAEYAQNSEDIGQFANSLDESASKLDAYIAALNEYRGANEDASSASATLVNSLFDANGQLTEAAKQALSTSGSMASMAQSFIEAQQAQAKADFSALILAIQEVGAAAAMTSAQIANMMAMAGVGGSPADMKRTYQQKYHKSADADPEAYKLWLTSTLQKSGEANYKRKMEEYQKQLSQVSVYAGGVGGGGGSSRKSAEEKAAEEAEKQAKKAQKAQEKAAKESQKAYESAAKSAEQAAQEAARAAEQAAEEAKQKILDSIQELKDASDDFWDSKTDAIEETNKELDRQKQLEEKLKALEEAKQKKILLYKNGQFQYDKDYGTIAKAQADYEETRDKIQRERELEQLKEMKDNATEIFNEMKDIVQNGGDVTQEMINNWLKNMAASGADYYDSNKKLLNEWLDWAKNALQTYGQGVVDAVNGYVSTSSLMSNGTYGSNAQGMVATDTNGARYLADRNSDNPLYWDKDGNFVGFTKAFWIDVFDAQIKKGQFGDYTKTDAWLGNMPGTSVFDNWKEVFEYWAKQPDADIYALQDMVDRFDAAKQVFNYYEDIFKSLGYDEYAKMAEQYKNVDTDEYWTMARKMMVAANPTDPSGDRKHIEAWRGTRTEDSAELYQVAMDLLYDFMGLNKTDADTWKNQFTDTALGEFFDTAKREWHINREDESDRYKYATFDPEALKKALEENEEALKQLSEKWFEAATDLDRQVIAAEAESRRKFRDLGYAQLGIDTTAQSEAERAANRQTSGKTLDEVRRDKKLANNVDDINKTLEKVENGQAISQGYITKASDYISKMIEENSEKWFTLYDQTEKDKLHQQTEELRALQEKLQKANDLAEINNLLVHGEALLPNEKADFEDKDWKEDKKYEDWVREAEDLDDTAEDIRRQMELNAQRWFDADEKTKDELHRANEELAERLAQETGTNLSYSGETGKWSKNATGTRNFRGGLSLVGERGPEMRILGQGDNIIPANQTANLWKWSNTTPQQMLTTLSARSGGGNTSYAFDVSRIELPNVTDAKSFVQGLKNYALQYSYKR